MIKELLLSFRDNFREKTSNPLLGTYVIVYLLRHWEAIYTVFNFDPDTSLYERIEILTGHFVKDSFIWDLGVNILWTFGVLIVTYGLLNLSRLIINFSEKQVTPWIYKITDSKTIVLKSTYERARNQIDEMQKRLDSEREIRSRLEGRITNLEEEIKNITESNLSKEASSENENISDKNEDEKLALSALKRLKAQGLEDAFVNISIQLDIEDKWIRIDDEKGIDLFLKLGLVKYDKYDGDLAQFRITPVGEKVLKYLRLR